MLNKKTILAWFYSYFEVHLNCQITAAKNSCQVHTMQQIPGTGTYDYNWQQN